MTAKGPRQIPIVCPGHTRPLAELQYIYVKDEDRTLLVSACHGECALFNFQANNYLVKVNLRILISHFIPPLLLFYFVYYCFLR